MLLVVIRKIISNKWLVACLLIGSILLVATVSTIPMYSAGVFQRMLTKDLEQYQNDYQTFPGTLEADANMTYFTETRSKYNMYWNMDGLMRNKISHDYNLPILSEFHRITFDHLKVVKEETSKDEGMITLKVEAIENLPEHVKLVGGRMFSKTPTQDGVFEVVITEEAMRDLGLVSNEVYTITSYTKDDSMSIKIQVVGVIAPDTTDENFWYEGISGYRKTLFMDWDLAKDYLIGQSIFDLSFAKWHYALDYHKILISDVDHITKSYTQQQRDLSGWKGVFVLKFPVIDILNEYYFRHMQLSTTLWILYVPVLIMLAFYIFMVAQLIVKHEANEIAVMKSRGASRFQIFKSYFLESLIYGIAAAIVGPMLGMFMCKVLGASNGFMEFINRTALPINLSMDAILYTVYSVLTFMLFMLIPAYRTSRTSIVEYKQKKAKTSTRPLWNKLFLDIILLAAAIYGLMNFQEMQQIMNVQQASETGFSIDPIMFFLSTFFIMGAGLFFLRIYPTIIKIVFSLGRGVWSPVMYSSFIQVGRSEGKEQFLMLFLIVSLSVGIFNANAARTINRNLEDKVMYRLGTDIVVQPYFESNQPMSTGAPPEMGDIPGGTGGQQTTVSTKPILYFEPNYYEYENIEGIESITKVFRNADATVRVMGVTVEHADLMGIISHEFGETAWFRDDLLPYHWYHYLNLLADNPSAVLLSSGFQQDGDVQLLDNVTYNWGKQSFTDGIVYGFVDYWPTWNPVYKKDFMTGKEVPPRLIVVNLNYLHNMTFLEPYEIWIKKAPDTTDMEITNQITDKKLRITGISYATQEIIKFKNDPLLQGINGSLTLSFVVTMIISIIGFLIYWILSIRDRVLQFGILRAMGLSKSKVIGMIVVEQILISVMAIFMGLVIGSITSQLYVPLLQMMYGAAEQVPPFEIISSTNDYLRIYVVVGFMLLLGTGILARFVASIRMDQAVKLGED
ncbi:MAG: FtsX-like permease family protein [Clostridiaceae bacterium]|nr:FtsX-like permease family protein [Clostridiaceae bacterium]